MSKFRDCRRCLLSYEGDVCLRCWKQVKGEWVLTCPICKTVIVGAVNALVVDESQGEGVCPHCDLSPIDDDDVTEDNFHEEVRDRD